MRRGELVALTTTTGALPLTAVRPPRHYETLTQLTPALASILKEVQRELGLEGDTKKEADALDRMIATAGVRLGFELTANEVDILRDHIIEERRSFGLLQQFVDDPAISDIIVTDYSKISVQQGRRNIVTGLSFPSQEAYQALVDRLLLLAGTSCSTKHPIADGMLGPSARMHVVHPCLCETGPYLTLRINRMSSVSLHTLQQAGIAPAAVLRYLEESVRQGLTVLIAGEVGTGKTTLVRGLASAVEEDQSVLVIEDTPEIRLSHPQARYIRTREANTEDRGEISPAECIRGGMRMAMNRIVFGEIRDAAAAEAFVDVCASGHPGLSTIHARSALDAIVRLELFLGRAQRGIAREVVREQIAAAVQIVVYVGMCAHSGRRRILDVREIGPVADGVMRQREIFRYVIESEVPCWKLVTRSSAHRDRLEGLGSASLHHLPDSLELEPEQLLRESRRGTTC